MIHFAHIVAISSIPVAVAGCGCRTGLLVDLLAADAGGVDANAADSAPPPPSQTPGAQLAVGDVSSCAVVQGSVWCWGDNSFGQLGQGTASAPQAFASAVPGLSGALEIASTLSADLGDPAHDEQSSHFCARLSDGSVWCWGPNVNGNPIPGTNASDFYTPTRIEGIEGAAQIVGGQLHTCVLSTDGSVRCWGDNGNDQLGNGSVGGHSNQPVLVANLPPAVEIAASQSGTCARLQSGSVFCWGAVSIVLDGGIARVPIPTPVPQLNNVEQIAGADYVCARIQNGGVVCLDDGGTRIDAITGITDAISISGKDTHACAVLTDSGVECWGENFDGVLGIGTTAAMGEVLPPQMVSDLTDVNEVHVSYYNTCAMTRGAAVWCWGDNGEGECGTSTPSQLLSPSRIQGLP
jgi:alpha-tubulin suppressor-like RCC1 family protein